MQRDPQFLSALHTLLSEECRLHTEYIALLEKEQVAVRQFKSDEVTQLAAQREKLAMALSSIQEKRLAFMQRFPDAESARLSELIVKHCHPEDARRLSPIVRKLKDLIAKSRQLGKELGQMATFSLSLINGTLSILWSATQTVTRSYGRKGQLKESFQSNQREVLKQV